MVLRTVPKMKFLCLGVGAIGTYLGGSLALAGQQVVFVERPGVAEAVRKHGLRLNLGGQEYSVPDPQIVPTIQEAIIQGPFDAGILAVKSFDTAGVLEMLAPYAAVLPPFLCFLNGVENEQLLINLLGVDKVIPGTVTSAIGRRAAGDIVLEKLRGIGLANTHILVPTLVAIFKAAGLNARIYDSAPSMKWSKMITNLPANATSAILDLTAGEIYRDKHLYQLEIRMLREALAVMRALHIPVVDLPGTPVRLLRFGIEDLPLPLSQPLLSRALGSGRGGKMPSFHIDLHSGRGKSEVDYLNGAVVRFGRQNGIATPVNQFLNLILQELTSGELPLTTYQHQPERFLNDFEQAISSGSPT